MAIPKNITKEHIEKAIKEIVPAQIPAQRLEQNYSLISPFQASLCPGLCAGLQDSPCYDTLLKRSTNKRRVLSLLTLYRYDKYFSPRPNRHGRATSFLYRNNRHRSA